MNAPAVSTGIFYMLTGDRHAAQLAVSLYALAEVFNGPVTIAAGDDRGLNKAQRFQCDNHLAKTLDIHVRTWDAPQGRNQGYRAKTFMNELSPYARTIFLDADTLPVARFLPAFEDVEQYDVILTSFAKWTSNTRPIRHRLDPWKKVAFNEVARCHAESFPAINTGVLAFSNSPRSFVWFNRWREMTDRHLSFICDELAAQLLVPSSYTKILSDDFNASPIHSRFESNQFASIWHGHGWKFIKRDQGWKLWQPWFRRAWDLNIGGMQSWARDVDRKLDQRLKDEEQKPWVKPA